MMSDDGVMTLMMIMRTPKTSPQGLDRAFQVRKVSALRKQQTSQRAWILHKAFKPGRHSSIPLYRTLCCDHPEDGTTILDTGGSSYDSPPTTL